MSKFSLLLTVCFALFFTNLATAQTELSFSHKAGLSGYMGPNAGGYGITYSPRLNFLPLGDAGTLSVGTHIGLGISGEFNSRTGGEGSFIFDLPLVVELNMGNSSHPDNENNFGGYFGGGFGYSKLALADTYYGTTSDTALGPIVNGGLSYKGYGLRFSYLYNTKKADDGLSEAGNVLSVGFQMTIK